MITNSLVTATQIANALQRSGVDVRHVLYTRDIEPVTRAGLVRLYNRSAIKRVGKALAQVDARRYRESTHAGDGNSRT